MYLKFTYLCPLKTNLNINDMKRLNFFIKTALGFFCVFSLIYLFYSCSKDFDEMNTETYKTIDAIYEEIPKIPNDSIVRIESVTVKDKFPAIK